MDKLVNLFPLKSCRRIHGELEALEESCGCGSTLVHQQHEADREGAIWRKTRFFRLIRTQGNEVN